jgi:hypothetical protein
MFLRDDSTRKASDFGIPKRGNFGIPKWDFSADARAFVGSNRPAEGDPGAVLQISLRQQHDIAAVGLRERHLTPSTRSVHRTG